MLCNLNLSSGDKTLILQLSWNRHSLIFANHWDLRQFRKHQLLIKFQLLRKKNQRSRKWGQRSQRSLSKPRMRRKKQLLKTRKLKRKKPNFQNKNLNKWRKHQNLQSSLQPKRSKKRSLTKSFQTRFRFKRNLSPKRPLRFCFSCKRLSRKLRHWRSKSSQYSLQWLHSNHLLKLKRNRHVGIWYLEKMKQRNLWILLQIQNLMSPPRKRKRRKPRISQSLYLSSQMVRIDTQSTELVVNGFVLLSLDLIVLLKQSSTIFQEVRTLVLTITIWKDSSQPTIPNIIMFLRTLISDLPF